MKRFLYSLLACCLLIQLSAQDGGGFSGTYLSILPDGANILQLTADGNMTFIMSDQFDHGGVVGDSYSNTKGVWKKSKKKTVIANTVDIAFGDSDFIGVAHARYTIQFGQNFQTATLSCKGAIYPPGVNPLEKNAEHVPNSDFTCGEPIHFQRLSAKE